MEFLRSTNCWGVFTLGVILTMTSGQMWNVIRAPPLLQWSPGNWQLTYFHASSRAQFVFETYVVLGLHAAVATGFILLIEARSERLHSVKQEVMSFLGLLCIVVFFSMLLSVFSAKY